MSTFGRYLTYRLRNSALRAAVFALISVILTLNTVATAVDYEDVAFRSVALPVFAVLLGLLCTVMPMMETTGFKNRRNLDTLYFFPITRRKMAIAHFLSGLIQAFAIYTVTFWTSFLYLVIRTDCFALRYMVGYYFASLAIGFIIYSVVIFIYGQANTDTDGAVFTVMWVFAISLAAFVIYTLLRRIVADANNPFYWSFYQISNWAILYAPINNLTVIFQNMIEINSWHSEQIAASYSNQWYMFVAWGVVGLAAAAGYLFTFERKGAQKVGEISDSPFGYRLLVPLYGYSLLFIMGTEELLAVPVFGAMIIGYIIYRRGVKLKARDLIVTACGIIPLIIGAVSLS